MFAPLYIGWVVQCQLYAASMAWSFSMMAGGYRPRPALRVVASNPLLERTPARATLAVVQ